MTDPFGSPAECADFSFPIPEEDANDPHGPIGTLVDGVFQPGKLSVPAKVTGWKKTTSKSGNSMVVCSVRILEGRYVGMTFDLYLVFIASARFRVVEAYKALGLPLDATVTASPIGNHCIVKLEDELYNDRWSPKPRSLLPPAQGAGYRGNAELPSAAPSALPADDDTIPF